LLLARAAELRERLNRVRADLRREREPLPADSRDAAVMVENDDVLRGIESTSVEELGHIDHALERLDAGSFGICETCGAEITSERLEAAPYATKCATCARKE
jgi:RNA polymerase-binding transcription factor DksA